MSKIRVEELETLDGLNLAKVEDLAKVGDPETGLDRRVIYVDTVADLQALDTSGLVEGQRVTTAGYYSHGDGGKNNYVIVAEGTGSDDGGSFIDIGGGGKQAKALFESSACVRQFGATTESWQTEVERLDAIQNAINYGSEKSLKIIIPSGTWVVSDLVKRPSNSFLYGSGIDSTIIKMSDNQGDVGKGLMVNEDTTNGNSYIYTEGMTLDANATGRGITNVGSGEPWTRSCLGLMIVDHATTKRVKFKEGLLHGAGVEGEEPDPEGPTIFSPNPSKWIVFESCISEDAGDDGIALAYTDNVIIRKHTHTFSSQRHPSANAPCGIELDETCRWVDIDGVYAERCVSAVAIKGKGTGTETDPPRSSYANVSNIIARRCTQGIRLQASSNDTIREVVNLNNIIVIEPERFGESDRPFCAVEHSAYRRVNASNIVAMGSLPAIEDLDSAITIRSSAGESSYTNCHVENWGRGQTSGSVAGVLITSSCFDISISNSSFKRTGLIGIRDSGSSSASIIGNTLFGEELEGSIGIWMLSHPDSVKSTVSSNTFRFYEKGAVFGSQDLGGMSILQGGLGFDGVLKAGLPRNTAMYHVIAEESRDNGDEYLRLQGANVNAQFYDRGEGPFAANSAASCMRIARMENTERSISAGGTINASGADYAEYHQVKEHLWGNVKPGSILGYTDDGLLTDRFYEIVGRCVVKSTRPYGVGGDDWGSEEKIIELYNLEPLGEEDSDGYSDRRKAFIDCYEEERKKWDRIAKSGYVPVNMSVTSDCVGSYVVPVNQGGIVGATLVGENDLTLEQYIKSIGCVIGITSDGRPLVEVKVV